MTATQSNRTANLEAEIQRLFGIVGESATRANEALSPYATRAGEMSMNGWHSLEDVRRSAFESGKEALSTGEAIIRNPKIFYDDVQSTVSKFTSWVKDKVHRREEIVLETRDSLAALFNITVSAVKNPVDSVTQLNEMARHVLKGAAQSAAHSTAHLTIGRKEIAALSYILAAQASEYRTLRSNATTHQIHPSASMHDYLDALLAGGDVMHEAMAMAVPPEILRAYELQYPRLSNLEDFRSLVHRLSDEQIRGLVSGLKGKLFEIQYADHLNNTELPAGYHAELAHAATQTGWDIQITGPDPDFVRLLQLKATDSVAYVQKALATYPDIDVVTPSDLHSQLVLRGLSEHVVDSGISHAHLKAEVHDGIEAGAHDFSPFPSVLAVAVLAFTSYDRNALLVHENARSFGTRTGSYLVSYWTGAASHMAIPVPFVGFAVAATVRLVVASGRKKVERLEAMASLVDENDMVLQRLRERDVPVIR